jgi:hypothetical protein
VISDTKFAFPPPPKTDVPPQKEDKAIATKLILNQPPKITWFSGTDLKSGDATYEIGFIPPIAPSSFVFDMLKKKKKIYKLK